MPFISPNTNLTGHLLVASPVLANTDFAQTVIYVCAHSSKEGAMGLVVNRRLNQPSMEELFQQLDIEPNPPRRVFGLGVGGPVEPGRGFVLHSSEWHESGTIATTDLAGVTASLDILRELAAGGGPKKAMMLLGHAGWKAGQLEEEILHGNAWYIAPATQKIVFEADPRCKWSNALASVGVTPSSLTQSVGEA